MSYHHHPQLVEGWSIRGRSLIIRYRLSWSTFFGLLKRRVYAKVTPDTQRKTWMGIIQDRIVPDSIVYSDGYHSYNVLDVSEFKHYRINPSKLFADKQNHINGIENFWNQSKRHMRRFNGIPAKHFSLFLKECEWRFNNPNPKTQIKPLK